MDPGFQELDSRSFVSGNLIPESNRYWDSEFLEVDSGVQSQGFRIPQEKISGISESVLPYGGGNG